MVECDWCEDDSISTEGASECNPCDRDEKANVQKTKCGMLRTSGFTARCSMEYLELKRFFNKIYPS